jgi:Neuraminidase (sialidase)
VAADGTLLASYIEADRYVEGQNSMSIGRGETTPIYLSRSSDGGVTWSPGKLVHEVGQEQWSGAQDTGPDAAHQYASPFGKMVTLPDGTILMPYGLDQLEEPNKSACFLVRSHDNGRTWTELVTIAEGHDEPSLCHLGDGHVIAMLRSKGLWQCDSHDSGYTWTEPHQVTGDMEFPGDVLQLRDGRLLLTYGRRVPPYGIQGMVSNDEGRTWDTDHRLLLVGDSGTTDCGYPSSVQRDDGAIVTVYYAWDTLAEHYGIGETGVHGAALIYRPEDLP